MFGKVAEILYVDENIMDHFTRHQLLNFLHHFENLCRIHSSAKSAQGTHYSTNTQALAFLPPDYLLESCFVSEAALVIIFMNELVSKSLIHPFEDVAGLYFDRRLFQRLAAARHELLLL